MPLLKNAKKALRVSQRKNVINQRIKSRVKSTIDKMKKTPSDDNLKGAFSAVDKAVKRNIFHKNRAARIKSGLSKLVSV